MIGDCAIVQDTTSRLNGKRRSFRISPVVLEQAVLDHARRMYRNRTAASGFIPNKFTAHDSRGRNQIVIRPDHHGAATPPALVALETAAFKRGPAGFIGQIDCPAVIRRVIINKSTASKRGGCINRYRATSFRRPIALEIAIFRGYRKAIYRAGGLVRRIIVGESAPDKRGIIRAIHRSDPICLIANEVTSRRRNYRTIYGPAGVRLVTNEFTAFRR